jgi:hypothetical protein
MGVTDCHVHINPLWEMRPDAVRMLGRTDERAAQFLKEPNEFLEYLSAADVERAVLVNYVAPEVLGVRADRPPTADRGRRHPPDASRPGRRGRAARHEARDPSDQAPPAPPTVPP